MTLNVQPFDLQNNKVKLQIWDISGRKKFLDYISCHFHGAFGVIFVYDVTNEESFKNIENWIKFVDEFADTNIVKVIIGNKCDLECDRIVSRIQGENLANECNALFWETSALWNMYIRELFTSLAERKFTSPPIETLQLPEKAGGK